MNKSKLEEIGKVIDNIHIDDTYYKHNPGKYRRGYKPHQYLRIHLLFCFGFFKSFNHLLRSLKYDQKLRKFCCLKFNKVPSKGRLSEFRKFSNLNFFEDLKKALLKKLEKMKVFDNDILILIPDSTDQPANCKGFGKKICDCNTNKCKCQKKYTASESTMGGRTKKPGQTKTFIGYKKHTLWIWLSYYSKLLPISSVTKTAIYPDSKGYLENIHFAKSVFPEKTILSVADMGYIDSETKRISRTVYNVSLVTAIKSNMIVDPNIFDKDGTPTCPEGNQLFHDEYDWENHLHYYRANIELCLSCPMFGTCNKIFTFSASIHETLLNPIPLHTDINKKLRKRMRPLCEAGNFKDKHIYNNNILFKNSLTITSFMNNISDIAHYLDMIVFVKKNENKKPRKLHDSRQLKLNLAA